MKVIAFYLPQFHNIPENDEWWGDGFTEWVNVKKSKPLYEGHYQPRVPLNENYYNLLDDNVKKWQVDLAKKYGIYGFCYYHYWFSGHMLLEKPMEQMLANKEIDLPFCVCWANEPWTKAWVGDAKKVLIPQNYGREKEWREHFDYLLPFFKDERYITVDGRPLFVLYRPEIVGCLNEMLDYWNKLAKENGFENGFCFAYQNIDFDLAKDKDDSRFDLNIEFEPLYAYRDMFANQHKYLKAIRRNVSNWVGKYIVDIYGEGDQKQFLKNKVRAYKLENRVFFHGNIPFAEMQEQYKKADVYCLPSLRETTGTAVFEAMANKLPIIALNQNGVKDIVQNDCGILVNVCSKEQVIVDLATALRKLIENDSMRQAMGEKAFWKIKKHYTWSKRVCAMNEIYRELVNNYGKKI